MATKWEPKKVLKEYYGAGKRPRLVDVAEMPFLVIEGRGSPHEQGPHSFQMAIGAVYSVVYAMKFAIKAEGRDFGIATVEASWWADPDEIERAGGEFASVPLERWRWRLRMPVPEFVREGDVAVAKAAALEKKGPGAVERVEHRRFGAARCVQAMHVGPYETEPGTIGVMREFMKAQDLELVQGAVQHEIYLSDPRRTAPERLRTILREAVGRRSRAA